MKKSMIICLLSVVLSSVNVFATNVVLENNEAKEISVDVTSCYPRSFNDKSWWEYALLIKGPNKSIHNGKFDFATMTTDVEGEFVYIKGIISEDKSRIDTKVIGILIAHNGKLILKDVFGRVVDQDGKEGMKAEIIPFKDSHGKVMFEDRVIREGRKFMVFYTLK